MSQGIKKPYKPSFNIQAYNVIDRVDLGIRETHPSREVIDLYSENPYYGGISIFFDNLGKVIWVWISSYQKKRDWAKKLANEKDLKKFTDLATKILEQELNCDLAGYTIKKVEENNHPDDFELLFLYEIQDFALYNKHYYRPDVEMRMPQEAPKIEDKVTNCPKCGWILSKGKTKCPRCQFVISTEPEKPKDEVATDSDLPPEGSDSDIPPEDSTQ